MGGKERRGSRKEKPMGKLSLSSRSDSKAKITMMRVRHLSVSRSKTSMPAALEMDSVWCISGVEYSSQNKGEKDVSSVCVTRHGDGTLVYGMQAVTSLVLSGRPRRCYRHSETRVTGWPHVAIPRRDQARGVEQNKGRLSPAQGCPLSLLK